MEKRRIAGVLVLVLVAAAGTAAVLVATRHGPGLSPDSVRYIAGARNILAGHGFTYQEGDGAYRPIANWPPLYSVVLALPGLVGVDPLRGARVVDAVLFGLTLLVVGWMVRRRGGSLIAAAFAMAALASVRTALIVYVMAWSESLFVLLTMCGLLALSRHLEKPGWGRLLTAVLAAGAAFMTRYPGIALAASGSAALLLWRKGGWWPRLRDAAVFGALTCLPVLLWMTRNVETAGTATSRHVTTHLVDVPHLLQGLYTVHSWLVPARMPMRLKPAVSGVLVAGAATLVVLLVLARRGRPGPEEPVRPVGPMLLFVGAYVGALLGAMTFAYPSCDLGSRYLYPVLPVLIAVLVRAAEDRLRGTRRAGVARVVFAVVGVVFIATNLLQTVPWTAGVRESGAGLLGRSWRDSPIIARLAALPPGTPIYSNRGEAIYILIGRNSYRLPHSDGSEIAAEDLAAMRSALQKGAVLAYFTTVDRPYLLSLGQIAAALPLRTVLRSDDGVICRWAGAPASGEGGRAVPASEARGLQ